MNTKKLYFIALIPGEKLKEEVMRLKEEFKLKYHARHALKSPPHITLQRPFRREEALEEKIISILNGFAVRQHSFEIQLSGFGYFEPRVVFVKIADHDEIKLLHQRLYKVLKDELCFKEKEMNKDIHPHLTLATRDLDRENFYKAQKDIQKKVFNRSFTVKSIFLLKHNGKYWDIYREFSFMD